MNLTLLFLLPKLASSSAFTEIQRGSIVKLTGVNTESFQNKIAKVLWSADSDPSEPEAKRWTSLILNGQHQGQIKNFKESKMSKVEYSAQIEVLKNQTKRKGWPFRTYVQIHGLQRGELNGKIGQIVALESGGIISEGRQSVFVRELSQFFKLKVENLEWHPEVPQNAPDSTSRSRSSNSRNTDPFTFSENPFTFDAPRDMNSLFGSNFFDFGSSSASSSDHPLFGSNGLGFGSGSTNLNGHPLFGSNGGTANRLASFADFFGANPNQHRFDFDRMMEEFRRLHPTQSPSASAPPGPGNDPAPNNNIYVGQCQNNASFSTLEEWKDQHLPMTVFVLPIPNQENMFHVFSETEVDALIRNRYYTNPFNPDQGLPSDKNGWWKRILQNPSSEHEESEEEYHSTAGDDEPSSILLEIERENEELRHKEQKVSEIIDQISAKRSAMENLEHLKIMNLHDKEELEKRLEEKKNEGKQLEDLIKEHKEEENVLETTLNELLKLPMDWSD